MATLDILRKLFVKKFGNKYEINNDDLLTEIGIDSLDLVEFMLEIEEKLKIEFTTEEIADLKYVRDVVALVNAKID